MSKRLLKKIIIWSASILVVLLVGAYFTMNYAIDKMLHLIAPTEIASLNQNLSQTNSNVVTTSPTPTASSVLKSNSMAPAPSADKQELTNKETSTPLAKETTTPNTALTYAAEISTDKAVQVEKQISLKDKTQISLILLKKLDSSDISLFSKMASSGLTVEEKAEAKKTILKKLTENEYNQLIQIAAKLGLSQGESYQDSIKEMTVK